MHSCSILRWFWLEIIDFFDAFCILLQMSVFLAHVGDRLRRLGGVLAGYGGEDVPATRLTRLFELVQAREPCF